MNILIISLRIVLAVLLMAFVVACSDDETPDSEAFRMERLIELEADEQENSFGVVLLDDGRLLVSLPYRRELRLYDPDSGEELDRIHTEPALAAMVKSTGGEIIAVSASLFDPDFNPENIEDPGTVNAFANNGIWHLDVDLAVTTQIARLPPDTFPVHVLPMDNNDFLVSDIWGDSIFHVSEEGGVSTWIQNPLLAGRPELAENSSHPPFAVGIEGLERQGDQVLGVVADHGRIISIPVLPDGRAGELEVLFEDNETLFGLAHIIADNDVIYGVSGFQSKIWKIDSSNEFNVITLADNASPVQVDTAFQIVKGNENEFFFTNNAFIQTPEKRPPLPGVIKFRNFD